MLGYLRQSQQLKTIEIYAISFWQLINFSKKNRYFKLIS